MTGIRVPWYLKLDFTQKNLSNNLRGLRLITGVRKSAFAGLTSLSMFLVG